MRARDHASASGFQHDWSAAQSRMVTKRNYRFGYAFAIASVVLMAAVATLVILLTRAHSLKLQQSAHIRVSGGEIQDLLNRNPSDTATDLPSVPRPALRDLVGRVPMARRVRVNGWMRRQDTGSKAHQDHQLISTWRSPTDFLLKTAGNEFLRSVPNIEDSLVRISDR